MKNFFLISLLVGAYFFYNTILGGFNETQNNYKVNMDTNVSEVKGLSQYVTQEEINDFGMRYSDIAKDEEKNVTLIPLRVALENKDTNKVLSFLKDNNLSVDVRMLSKRTPLMYSTFYNDTNTTKELLKLNADFNTTDKYRLSPLAYAIENNSTKTVKQLIENGARFEDIEFVQGYLSTSSYGIIKSLEIDENNITKINFEHQFGDINEGSKDGMDLFKYIVSRNLVEMAKIVLESGYKPKKSTYSKIGLPGLYKETSKETSPFAYIILKPNYKPMLKLCLKYVGKPSKEHLKKAYKQCHWDYEDYKRSSKEKAFYNYLSNIDSLNSYTKHCSNKDGVFTPETYFSWANEWERLMAIYNFKTSTDISGRDNKDKIFYINSNSNNTNNKKD